MEFFVFWLMSTAGCLILSFICWYGFMKVGNNKLDNSGTGWFLFWMFMCLIPVVQLAIPCVAFIIFMAEWVAYGKAWNLTTLKNLLGRLTKIPTK